MDFQQYIRPELLILIPVLYLMGMAVKKSERIDKYIPIFLGVFGILLSALYVFSTSEVTNVKELATMMFTAITQGVLCAGMSVYANQIVKQMKKED